MTAQDYHGSIIAFRNDRMGARLMTMMNTIRIARDYDMPYYFVWKTDGRTSEELLAPTEIFDAAYFAAHEIAITDYRDVPPHALDLQFLGAHSTADDFKTLIQSQTPLICQGASLMVLPWERADDVAPRYAAAIQDLQFNPSVTAAMVAVDATLAHSGTAFHIRRGDIIYNPVTSNQVWSNKYIPREFYEVLAKRLITDPEARILVFSDEPAEIAHLKALSPQILGAADVIPADLTLAQRDFIELYAMSRCAKIYGPPSSGFSMTAGLMGNCAVHDVRSALHDTEHNAALDLLVARLERDDPIFLSDGDIGQCLPFAVDHLNATGRGAQALDLLQSYDSRGFHKMFFYQLLLRQNMIMGQYTAPAQIIETFTNAPLDMAIQGRLETHWAEVQRLSAIAAAHAGDQARAQYHITLALWYAPIHRPTVVNLCQMIGTGLIDPATCAIPFDPAVRRPLPPATAQTILTREPHPALAPPLHGQTFDVIPLDIMAYDWRPFLGKRLMRGFGEPAMIRRSVDVITTQFARHLPADVMASVLGLYAHVAGETDKALDLLEMALSEQPDHPLWIKRAAIARLAVDAQDETAASMLARAAEIGGPHSLYAAALADHYWTRDQRPQAVKIMQQLCTADFVLPEVAFLTAQMMRQARQTGVAALGYVDQALASAPHIRRYMALRTHILCDLGSHDQAHAMIDTIIARFGEARDIERLRARAGD